MVENECRDVHAKALLPHPARTMLGKSAVPYELVEEYMAAYDGLFGTRPTHVARVGSEAGETGSIVCAIL